MLNPTPRSQWRTVVVALLLVVIGNMLVGPARQPALAAGIPQPTLVLSTAHGYAGQPITVSGVGAAPYTGVRIAWMSDGTSATLAVVDVPDSGNYSTTVSVPSQAAVGTAQICAAVTGAAEATFTCADFVVDQPPAGGVSGTLPLPAGAQLQAGALDARVQLYDRAGAIVASGVVGPDGAFALPNVPAGSYTAAVVGTVPDLIDNQSVTIQPGQVSPLIFQPTGECYAAATVAVRAFPSAQPTAEWDFGSYLSFTPYSPPPHVRFEADIQVASGASFTALAFTTDWPDGSNGVLDVVSTPIPGTTNSFAITPINNVGGWDPGITILHVKPMATLFKDGKSCSEEREQTRRVNIVAHPMQPTPLQSNNDRRVQDVKWDGSRYVFDLIIPNNFNTLDISFNGQTSAYPDPAPKFPLLGTVNTKLAFAFRVRGTLELDGTTRVTMTDVKSRSSILGGASKLELDPLVPEGGLPLGFDSLFTSLEQPGAATAPLQQSPFAMQGLAGLGGMPGVDQLRQLSYPIDPITLFEYKNELPVYDGVIANIGSGINSVSIKASVKIGAEGKAVLVAMIRPLAPAIDAKLHLLAKPTVQIDVTASGFYGLVSSTLTLKVSGALRLVFAINADDPRVTWLEDQCMQLRVEMRVTVTFLYFVNFVAYDEVLADYHEPAGCSAELPLPAASGIDAAPPRVIASPQIAGDAQGRMVAVYVRDATPEAAQATTQVVARFWDAAQGRWGDPLPITDGAQLVDAPTVTFAGTSGHALAVWAQKVMSAAEEQAAGMAADLHLKRFELFSSNWNGSAWSAPQRLTTNGTSDGRPSVAGDANGATLGWLRDLDGAPNTRKDQHVVVSLWDAAQNSWSQEALLNGSPAANTMNMQVRAARRAGTSMLIWSSDYDGNIATNNDRRLIIADRVNNAWQLSQPIQLPVGAEVPSLTLRSDGVAFAGFLVRGKDADNKDTGIGDQSVVWTARRQSGTWAATQVTDETGRPVRGEDPQLSIGQSGEALMAFRRFGAVGTNAELGQVALAQLRDNGSATAPIYVTDEAKQHWQPALGINQVTGEAVVLHIGRPSATAPAVLAELEAANAPGSGMSQRALVLDATGDSLESAVIDQTADPALAPELSFSSLQSAPGSTLTISATVRNLGRVSASGLSVTLYQGVPGNGSPLGTASVPVALGLNEQQVVAFQVSAPAGRTSMYAVVSGGPGNALTANDQASGEVGALPPPTLVRAFRSPESRTAVEVVWQPSSVEGVTHYRILRRISGGGAYEFVGQTTKFGFVDQRVPGGISYDYAVQAVNGAGLVSDPGGPASILVAESGSKVAYLPFVTR